MTTEPTAAEAVAAVARLGQRHRDIRDAETETRVQQKAAIVVAFRAGASRRDILAATSLSEKTVSVLQNQAGATRRQRRT